MSKAGVRVTKYLFLHLPVYIKTKSIVCFFVPTEDIHAIIDYAGRMAVTRCWNVPCNLRSTPFIGFCVKNVKSIAGKIIIPSTKEINFMPVS